MQRPKVKRVSDMLSDPISSNFLWSPVLHAMVSEPMVSEQVVSSRSDLLTLGMNLELPMVIILEYIHFSMY